MLVIDREPLYKNRFFLGAATVLLGFLLTVAIIRAVNPADTSTRQSSQPASERRASSINPIASSDSESSSEKDNAAKNDTAASSGSQAADSNTASPSSTMAPAPNYSTKSWSAPSSQPSTGGGTSTPSSSTPAPATSSPTSSTTTTQPQPQPQPQPTQPAPTCKLLNVLGICILY